MILAAVLSSYSTLPYLIWNGLFFIMGGIQDRKTYGWVSSEYHCSNPILSLNSPICRYRFPSVEGVRFRGWCTWADLCNLYTPCSLGFIISIWQYKACIPRWVDIELLVHVHKLSVGLLISRSHNFTSGVADSQMWHFAYLNNLLACFLCILPLLEQMIALHIKELIIVFII